MYDLPSQLDAGLYFLNVVAIGSVINERARDTGIGNKLNALKHFIHERFGLCELHSCDRLETLDGNSSPAGISDVLGDVHTGASEREEGAGCPFLGGASRHFHQEKSLPLITTRIGNNDFFGIPRHYIGLTVMDSQVIP